MPVFAQPLVLADVFKILLESNPQRAVTTPVNGSGAARATSPRTESSQIEQPERPHVDVCSEVLVGHGYTQGLDLDVVIESSSAQIAQLC